MSTSNCTAPLSLDEDLKQLIISYTNLISSEETLDGIRSQVSFATAECLTTFIKVAETVGKNYKDAQSCRIVELVSHAISKSNISSDARVQIALAEFSISRCSSLLEAGSVAEHVLPSAREAFLRDRSLSETSLMMRYLGKLLKLNPRIMYSKITAKKNICNLILDWIDAIGGSLSSSESESKYNKPTVTVNLIDGYKAATELLKVLTLAFRGERSGVIIFLVAKLIAILRILAEHLHFSILLLNDCLCPVLSDDCGLLTDKYKLSINEDTLSKLHDDADENVFEFLIEYLPLEYSPDPDDNLTAEELRAALLSALIQPSCSERLYQMIAERILETDTEEERRQLFLALEASLTADAQLHSNLSTMSTALTTVINSVASNHPQQIGSLNDLFLGISALFERLFKKTLPEAFCSNLPSLQTMFALLAKIACNIVHSSICLPNLIGLHLSADHIDKLQKSTNLSGLLNRMLTDKLAVSLTPAGYTDDLFYQITNELIYDQFPSADRAAKQSLLLMLSHYDKEIANTFSAHLEDTIKREISMGSTENMRIFSSNCKLLCTYCRLDQGKDAFSSTFFNLLVEHLITGDVIEGSLFIEILNECMTLAEGHAMQACKFSTLFNDANRKHWARFGLKTHVIAIAFSNCHLISDPILSSQLLETIQVYIGDVPSPTVETIDDLLCIARYYYALSSVGLNLPETHPICGPIMSFCQTHVAKDVIDGLKTSLLFGIINHVAGVSETARRRLCSIVANVDLHILRAMDMKETASFPSAFSSLARNRQNVRATVHEEFESLFVSSIVTHNDNVLAVFEDLLNDEHFQAIIKGIIEKTGAGSAVFNLVEQINKLEQSPDKNLHAEVVRYCLHLSMRLQSYVFDSHPDACTIIEKALRHMLPDALFIVQHLSQPIRSEYIKICAKLADTNFDAQYCTLIAMNSIAWCLPEEIPIFTSIVTRLIGTVASLGEHGPRIVSALTQFVIQASSEIDQLHSFISSVLEALKHIDRPAFYAAILTLQETSAAYAYQLTSKVISLGELLEDLPHSTLCGEILEQRITSYQLDQEGVLVLLEKSMKLLNGPNAEIIHRCALIVAAIGRLRYGIGADPVAYAFLEPKQPEVANRLGTLLSAPLRSTRNAIRVARLVWMQSTT